MSQREANRQAIFLHCTLERAPLSGLKTWHDMAGYMDPGHKTANPLFKIFSCWLAMPHRFALRLTKLPSKIVIEVRRCEKMTPSRPPLYLSFLNIDIFQISLLFLHLGLAGLLLSLTSYMHGVFQLLVCIWYINVTVNYKSANELQLPSS